MFKPIFADVPKMETENYIYYTEADSLIGGRQINEKNNDCFNGICSDVYDWMRIFKSCRRWSVQCMSPEKELL